MSKKIAENPDSLFLDVKSGRGAFLRDWDQTVALAQVVHVVMACAVCIRDNSDDLHALCCFMPL